MGDTCGLLPPRMLATAVCAAAAAATFALTVPTDVQMPGTQPNEIVGIQYSGICGSCHGFYQPDVEPYLTWKSSMMAHASRDPPFWAALAVAGISQEWAAKLIAMGTDPATPLEFDRRTGAPVATLGQLAAQPPGTLHASFHFVLNDVVLADNRIPPWGLRYADALARNCLPALGRSSTRSSAGRSTRGVPPALPINIVGVRDVAGAGQRRQPAASRRRRPQPRARVARYRHGGAGTDGAT